MKTENLTAPEALDAMMEGREVIGSNTLRYRVSVGRIKYFSSFSRTWDNSYDFILAAPFRLVNAKPEYVEAKELPFEIKYYLEGHTLRHDFLALYNTLSKRIWKLEQKIKGENK